jgi:hypothetical protein
MIPSNGKTHVETISTLTDPNASEPMQPDAQPSVLSLREMAKRTAQGIVLIGQWLSEAKQQLPHGDWLPWLKESFGWTDQSARNFIHVYERFKFKNFLNFEFGDRRLCALSNRYSPLFKNRRRIEYFESAGAGAHHSPLVGRAAYPSIAPYVTAALACVSLG